MKITLESTSRLVEVNGVPARVWEGTTERGVPVVAMITRVAVREDHDASEFERDLQETRQPTAIGAWIPSRMIL